MAYGPIYEFAFDSQNGADILIVISKKNYTGEVTRRPLGRAPILKRENNGHVYGTSLEIYAECKVDGEYAEFYTSSADEFKVNVYKDQIPIWTGFITPELYSEPDIAPPYDVQIIATDGLGELKNYPFNSINASSLHDHFANMMNHTGLSLEIAMVSALKYYNGESASLPQDLLDLRLDLSHENGSSCYDVLQHMLSALNASISQFDDKWFIFRETDFIHLASEQGLDAFKPGENPHKLEINSFGSAASAEWWPIGQMSTSIEPAKNRLNLTSPNHYKGNVLGSSWAMENGASYDETEGAYVLPDEGSYIVQKLDFGGDRVEYRLALRISARNVGSGEEDQPLGIRVVIDGRSYSGERQYWLVQSASSDRGVGAYLWKTSEGEIEAELAVPSDSDTAADAQDVDIILPLYRNGNRSYVGATSVEVTVFNPAGIHDIYVYGASLSKYDQFEGYQADVVLENGAREEASSVDLTILDGAKAPEGSVVFMSGIPLLPGANTSITAWGIGSSASEDYLSLMSKDYSKEVALPRMSYKGTMNVPRGTMPVLFVRDNTYYFPRTYSYNLLDDELEVDLISIPAAEVTATSVVVSQMTQSEGSFSSGGSGGGGGIGTGIDLSGYAKKEEVTALSDLLASMWSIDAAGNLVATKDVIIPNLVVRDDTASGAKGTDGGVAGGLLGIKVNGVTYDNPVNGILTIPDYPTSLEWSAINGKPTKLTEFTNDAGFITSAALNGYAKTSDLPTKTSLGLANVENKSSATIRGEITSANVTNALGYTPLSTAGGTMSAGIEWSNNIRSWNEPVAGFELISTTNENLGYYCGISANGYYGMQIRAYGGANEKFEIRSKTSQRWQSWRTLYHTGNFNPADYLPLSGGTISGTTTDPIIVNTSTESVGIRLQINKANKAYVGYGSSVGAYLYNYDTGAYIGVDTSGSPFYHNGTIKNTLIHSGNIGSQKVAGLATARTIWGQSFDGTGNVSGALSNVGAITRSFQYAVDADQAGNLTFKTNVTEWKFNNSAGSTIVSVNGASNSVGIGVNNPTYKLDVNGVARATGWIGNNVNISCDANGNTSGYSGEINRFGGGKLWIQAREGGLELGNSAGINFNGAVTMSSTLSVSGNVGIGTTNTEYKLDVSGTGRFKAASASDNYTALRITNAWYGGSGKKNTDIVMESSVGYRGGVIRCTIDAAYGSFDSLSFGEGSNGASSYIPYLTIAAGGNVTIAKNFIVAGDTSSGSDIRFKDIKEHFVFDLETMANAPLFAFTWNDRNDNEVHIGGSAQYWQCVRKELVRGEEFLSMNYIAVNYGMGVSLAKKALNHEERIKILEDKVKALEAENRRLRYGS